MMTVADMRRLGLGAVDPELETIRRKMRARYGMGAPLSGLAAAALPAVVRSVTFRSNLSPEVSWSPGDPTPRDSTGAPASSSALSTVQPAFDVELVTGQRFTVAPGGEPDPDSWKTAAAALALGVLVPVGIAGAVGFFLGRASA